MSRAESKFNLLLAAGWRVSWTTDVRDGGQVWNVGIIKADGESHKVTASHLTAGIDRLAEIIGLADESEPQASREDDQFILERDHKILEIAQQMLRQIYAAPDEAIASALAGQGLKIQPHHVALALSHRPEVFTLNDRGFWKLTVSARL